MASLSFTHLSLGILSSFILVNCDSSAPNIDTSRSSLDTVEKVKVESFYLEDQPCLVGYCLSNTADEFVAALPEGKQFKKIDHARDNTQIKLGERVYIFGLDFELTYSNYSTASGKAKRSLDLWRREKTHEFSLCQDQFEGVLNSVSSQLSSYEVLQNAGSVYGEDAYSGRQTRDGVSYLLSTHIYEHEVVMISSLTSALGQQLILTGAFMNYGESYCNIRIKFRG